MDVAPTNAWLGQNRQNLLQLGVLFLYMKIAPHAQVTAALAQPRLQLRLYLQGLSAEMKIVGQMKQL